MEATGKELLKYGGHTKERSKYKEAEIVLVARDRNTEATLKHKEAEIPREQNRYGKTEEVEIWRPQERTRGHKKRPIL